MSAILLSLLLTAAKPVTIYVGPVVREGFVEVDQGVLDSIQDLQGELRKDAKTYIVTTNESAAVLKLYVLGRGKVLTGASIGVGTGTATASGGVATGTGTTVTIPDEANRLETLLRVGEYERSFVSQHGWAWKKAAGAVVKDLTLWVKANRAKLQ